MAIRERKLSSTNFAMVFLLVQSADHITGLTGATPTVTLSKNGASFGAAAGAVTEVGSGWYALAGNATDRNTTGTLILHAIAASGDPTDEKYTIVQYDPFLIFDANNRVDEGFINSVATTPVTTVGANVGTTQPLNFTGTGASALVKGDAVDILGTAISTPATAGILDVNVKNVGNVLQSGGDIYAAVSNIAVTSAALNTTATSRTITTGSGTGGVANTAAADSVYDNLSDTAGTLDFYYEFNISATVGAVGVGVEWLGYLVGVANTVKVYAYNWGGASYDQIGTVVGIAGTLNMTQDWELTSAHTGTGGNAGLVRIRFAATGLVTATFKTDRILVGYAVVSLAASAYTAPDNTSVAAIKVQTDKLAFTVTNQVDANPLSWKGGAIPTPNVTGEPLVDVNHWRGSVPDILSSGKIPADLKLWLTVAPLALSSQLVQSIVNAYASGQAPLQPTVPGRTIDIASTGEAGLDFDNIKDATGSHTLTNITVPIVTTTGTTTNSTNAPTAGDFTATMKTSLNAATPSVTVSDKTGFSLSVAGILAIWNQLKTDGGIIANSLGKALKDTETNSNSIITKIGTLSQGTIGAQLDDIDGAIGSITTFFAAYVPAIKAQTDKLIFTASNFVEVQLMRWLTDNGAGTPNALSSGNVPTATVSVPTVQQITNGVWDEAIAGHLTAGSTGLALNNAGAVGSDPWATALPNGYVAGQAGYILGNFSGTIFPAGANEVTFTVKNSITTLPINGAKIWISTDIAGVNIRWAGTTDAFGVSRNVLNEKPFLDTGDWYAWVSDPGYTDSNPTLLDVHP